ncbi:MAG: hypothetical protein E7Z86_02150 [Methanosphaera stadtmanae]|nr:hypothetical protein [Methanosphaera stadtmanae]
MEDINFKEIIDTKVILISIVLILAFTTLSTSTAVAPFFMFVGIIIGIIESNDKTKILANTTIATVIGSIISFIISIIVVYYTESPLYAIVTLQSYPVYLVLNLLYIILALTGGMIGYYIVDEIKNN